MRATVTLTVDGTASTARRYVFLEPTTLVAGRADDCDLRIAENDKRVSRHHCLFDINPPDLLVRDLDSLNGTYVNGVRIGLSDPAVHSGARPESGERDLADGDEVRIGGTVLGVSVFVTGGADPLPSRCEHCGRDTSDEGDTRAGTFVCAACRRDPRSIVLGLLRRASAGDGRLAAIRGYEIIKELGRGGQGVVYLARHECSGELAAVKVILAEVAVDPDARNGFLREIENTRALRHPNVVEFRGSGTSDAALFFGSEFCDGGSLDRLVARRGGPMAVEEAVPIAVQVLDALAYAHSAPIPGVRLADGTVGLGRGLVHRDVKPQNILLAGQGPRAVVKLADFGLAKAFDRAGLSGHTRTGTVGGSVAFMPRAQIVNYKFAKPEVDVWATAGSLYWMLTGKAPRDFPTGTDPVTVVLREPTVPIRARVSSIPSSLAAVIDEMLIDSPGFSAMSAEEFKHALLDAL